MTPTVLMGFSSFKDGRFELIVRDDESGAETTLHGILKPGQMELVDRILPTCVFVQVRAHEE